jgi:hypothetical protein
MTNSRVEPFYTKCEKHQIKNIEKQQNIRPTNYKTQKHNKSVFLAFNNYLGKKKPRCLSKRKLKPIIYT